MNLHKIKIRREYAAPVYEGEKTFEVRINDRDYKVGDYVRFQVVDNDGMTFIDHPLNNKEYVITYVLKNFFVESDWVVFSIREYF